MSKTTMSDIYTSYKRAIKNYNENNTEANALEVVRLKWAINGCYGLNPSGRMDENNGFKKQNTQETT